MGRFRLKLILFVLDLHIAPCATDYSGFRQFNLYFMAKSIKNTLSYRETSKLIQIKFLTVVLFELGMYSPVQLALV